MTLRKAAKMQLKPDPDQARGQLDELAWRTDPGTGRGRATAARGRRGTDPARTGSHRHRLRRGLVGTGDAPAASPSSRPGGPGPGWRNRLPATWEQGADIADETGVGKVADMAAALLRSVASSGHG